MKSRRGSATLILLGMGFIVAGIAITFSFYFFNNAKNQTKYVEGLQRRELAYAVMNNLLQEDITEAARDSSEFVLQPNQTKLQLTKSVDFSSDNHFKICKVQVKSGDEEFNLCQQSFIPTEEMQSLAANYAFCPKSALSSTTKKYIGDTTYFKASTFNIPKYGECKFLLFDLDEVKHYGFPSSILYHSGNLTLPKMNYAGDVVLIVTGDLEIATGATFSGRTIFIVGNTTTINKNVTMNDAFLLSYGAITISANCKITGHLRTNFGINLKGNGTFVTKEDAGRPFNSVVYIE